MMRINPSIPTAATQTTTAAAPRPAVQRRATPANRAAFAAPELAGPRAEVEPSCFARAVNAAFIAIMTRLFGRNA